MIHLLEEDCCPMKTDKLNIHRCIISSDDQSSNEIRCCCCNLKSYLTTQRSGSTSESKSWFDWQAMLKIVVFLSVIEID